MISPRRDKPSNEEQEEEQEMALDEKQIARIQALLAKAASTEFEGEADVYLAKAAALMAKYDLDEADVRMAQAAATGETFSEEIGTWRMEVSTTGNYTKARINAIFNMVHAMGGRSFFTIVKGTGVGYRQHTSMTIIAQESILANLKLFIPAALLHMENIAEKTAKDAIKRAKENGTFDRQTAYVARRSFMRGFGEGVAERIRSQRDEDLASGPDSHALVLRSRAKALNDYMDTRYPDLRASRARGGSEDHQARRTGKNTGRAFGSPNVGNGGRKALSA